MISRVNPLDVEHEPLNITLRFLARELAARGVRLSLLDSQPNVQVVKAELPDGRVELLFDIDSSLIPYTAAIAAGDKELTRKLLTRAGVRVPRGRALRRGEAHLAAGVAEELGFPVVVKPCCGSRGLGVYAALKTKEAVRSAAESVEALRPATGRFLVEEHVFGDEHRVFLSARGDYAVIRRDPASVLGDGVRSIAELARAESERRTTPRTTCLGPILLDDVVGAFLSEQGLALSSVPSAGQHVLLRPSSNLSAGGSCEDVTDRVHRSVLEICARAIAAIPGLAYAGIDFVTTDIEADQAEIGHAILELNSAPGIGMHIAPGKGRSRNAAAVLAEMILGQRAAAARAAPAAPGGGFHPIG